MPVRVPRGGLPGRPRRLSRSRLATLSQARSVRGGVVRSLGRERRLVHLGASSVVSGRPRLPAVTIIVSVLSGPAEAVPSSRSTGCPHHLGDLEPWIGRALSPEPEPRGSSASPRPPVRRRVARSRVAFATHASHFPHRVGDAFPARRPCPGPLDRMWILSPVPAPKCRSGCSVPHLLHRSRGGSFRTEPLAFFCRQSDSVCAGSSNDVPPWSSHGFRRTAQ